jgi:hypothetical protein
MITLPLQLAGTLYPIRIPIDKQFDHRPGIVFGIANFMPVYFNSQFMKIKSLNKGVIGSDRIIVSYVFFNAMGKQTNLIAITTSICHGVSPFDKSLSYQRVL